MGDPGVVRLHIDSPLPATVIEQRSTVVGAYAGYGIVLHQQRTVCTSPCDTVVDGSAGRAFRLADDTYPSPGPFNFSGMTGEVTMHILPGSTALRDGGGWTIGLGAIAVITGAIMLPIALGTTTTDLNTMVEVKTPNRPLRSAGIGLLAGGLVALGGGIAMVVKGATHLRIEPGGAPAPAPPPTKAARIAPRYWMGEF